ncbi:hypothetical protein PVAND_009205 [Polypedilum vanderplanki]|uniref:Uncharacterized protein n=1 Tax=Polypedilum vanderplanki TaxID=319348 RepID=A0A9J6CC66_POLVA|nr:hypothetical protein PVAND_009205 [Polypedilum vanderplanki]
MKFFSLAILICCFATFTFANSVTIQCYYFSSYWADLYQKEYQCSVENKEVFDGNRVTIEKAEGNHKDGNSDDDVKFFKIEEANLKYFPKNLENIFKKLEMIAILDSELKEITSEDLKPFPKLEILKLQNNRIEVINEDLFSHNPQLRYINLFHNKISHIDSNAFSHLNDLGYLNLGENVCELEKDWSDYRKAVLKIVQEIEQGKCQRPQ